MYSVHCTPQNFLTSTIWIPAANVGHISLASVVECFVELNSGKVQVHGYGKWSWSIAIAQSSGEKRWHRFLVQGNEVLVQSIWWCRLPEWCSAPSSTSIQLSIGPRALPMKALCDPDLSTLKALSSSSSQTILILLLSSFYQGIWTLVSTQL